MKNSSDLSLYSDSTQCTFDSVEIFDKLKNKYKVGCKCEQDIGYGIY